MKALILAAGIGSRLKPISDNLPKAMVPVNGKSILEKQIENLKEQGILDIIVIAGYKADYLYEFIMHKFPFVKIINNIDYADTNNMYSAYLAKDLIGDNNLILMNGDVFFDSSNLTNLLSSKHENAILVDVDYYSEESMKVTVFNERITGISKKISSKDSFGTSIDIYKFSRKAVQAFFEQCRYYIEDEKLLNLWSEVAINDLFNNLHFGTSFTSGRWYEIDSIEDLENAENIFRE